MAYLKNRLTTIEDFCKNDQRTAYTIPYKMFERLPVVERSKLIEYMISDFDNLNITITDDPNQEKIDSPYDDFFDGKITMDELHKKSQEIDPFSGETEEFIDDYLDSDFAVTDEWLESISE